MSIGVTGFGPRSGGGSLQAVAGDVGAGVLLDGAADQVAGAEADGKREGQDDAAEEDAEGEIDDRTTDLQVVEHHCGGEDGVPAT